MCCSCLQWVPSVTDRSHHTWSCSENLGSADLLNTEHVSSPESDLITMRFPLTGPGTEISAETLWLKDSNQGSEPVMISITQTDLERTWRLSPTHPRVETKKLSLTVGARPRQLRPVAALFLFHLLSAPQSRRQWDKKDAADGGGCN